ncbi:DRTGG domain-containing protein [Tindallia californiensis]|uniref:DRTGG domain-containing protein n=1 Tax=Tindallia californiensis TaxID=159292 RepID=A0A1H3NAM9_9FIRM|nr:DRTGG domain-containing protein [Tindallia californiensis]SDY85952.1 DRTGG domain-containing protein [Tindallia californiensis]
MTIKELRQHLNLEVVVLPENTEDRVIKDVYIGDMLSWVIGNAEHDSLWITIQTNINIIAVAVMVGINCIIVAENATIDADTVNRAEEEGIPIFRTPLTAYHIAKRIDLGS